MKARKIIIPVAIVAGVAALGVGIVALTNSASAVAYTDASLVEAQDALRNYISVTGTVQSENLSKVYSTLNYPVEEVYVEVGDTVKKGDILCTLNTDDLQTQILQQQATVDSSSINEEYQLTQAEKNYNEAYEEYTNGTNSSVITASNSLEQAKITLERAQENYDKAIEMSDMDKNTQLQNAELTLKNARVALEEAEKDYDKAKAALEDEDYYSIKDLKDAYDDANDVLKSAKGTSTELREAYDAYNEAYTTYTLYYYNADLIPIDKTLSSYAGLLSEAERNLAAIKEKYGVKDATDSYTDAFTAYEKAKIQLDEKNQSTLDAAQVQLESAKNSLASAEIALQAAKDNNNDGVENYKIQLADAQRAYEAEKESYNLTIKSVEANLASLKATADRERTLSGTNDAQLIALEALKEQLDEAVITAPCDGTVTLVGATKGSSPVGTLFAIEDQSNLKVTANLREYDVTSVKKGMAVVIKSDALDGIEYEGIVTKIAPTAAKNADGSDAGTALFAVEIAVTSSDTDLKIGMTAKMQIIIEEKENVLAVMYDSVATDENGNDIIYIAEKTDTGYTVKVVPVTVGIQTDFYAEIMGDGISDDTIVINDIELITEGQNVLIDETELGISDTATTETAQTE